MQGFFGVHTDVRHHVNENQIISSLPQTKAKFENAVWKAGYLALLEKFAMVIPRSNKMYSAINHKLRTVRVDIP